MWWPYTSPSPQICNSYQRKESQTILLSVSSNSWLCRRTSYNEGFIPQVLNHSKFPVGPSILQTQPCSMPCDERRSWVDKTHNPRVNSDTPGAKQLGAGAEEAGAVGGMRMSSQQPCLRSLGNPWQRAQAEVLTRSSLRNCGCSFFLWATYW